jgi:hypothetical protein
MVHKKLVHLLLFLLVYYAQITIHSSGLESFLTITDNVTGYSIDYHEPFLHDFLGRISWNNTHIAILNKSSIITCDSQNPDKLPMKSNDDYHNYKYENLTNWNNSSVIAYLIPWPKTLVHSQADLTTSVEPLEGNKKSFIESWAFRRCGLNETLQLVIGSRNPSPRLQTSNFHSQKFSQQLRPGEEADIFYNNRYMIICYNKEGFEITNIAQLNGFSLDLDQRRTLIDSTLYLWECKDTSITIKSSPEGDSQTHTLQIKNLNKKQQIDKNHDETINTKPQKSDSFFKKLLSYKWFLLCCVAGILGIIIIIKKSAQSR